MIRNVIGHLSILAGLVLGMDLLIADLIAPGVDPWPRLYLMVILVLGGMAVLAGLSEQR